jgi:O-antigen/teichoic acid export membrane protein
LLVKTNYGEVGLFTSADQWAQMILFLPVAISSVLLSYLSNSVGNVSVYNNILKKNILFNIALALVLATILSIGSKTIFYFYGESFEEAYKILSIMAFAMVPMAVINVFEQALISRSKSKLIAIFKFVRQSLVLIFAFFFLSIKPEATSLAMSFLIGYSSATVLMAMYIWKVFFRKTQIPVSS